MWTSMNLLIQPHRISPPYQVPANAQTKAFPPHLLFSDRPQHNIIDNAVLLYKNIQYMFNCIKWLIKQVSVSQISHVMIN